MIAEKTRIPRFVLLLLVAVGAVNALALLSLVQYVSTPWSIVYSVPYFLLPCFIGSLLIGSLAGVGALIAARGVEEGPPSASTPGRIGIGAGIGAAVGGAPLLAFLLWIMQNNAVGIVLIVIGASIVIGALVWVARTRARADSMAARLRHART